MSDYTYRKIITDREGVATGEKILNVPDEEVSDNICEWRKIKGNSCLFETNCNNISGMYRGFNFCPYCGNRIKVKQNDN